MNVPFSMRIVVVAGAALVALTLAGCGRYPAGPAAQANPSRSGTDLAAYVMDTNPAPASPGTAAPAPDCSKGKDAYDALVVLVSTDTGTPVKTIAERLRGGSSLNDIAGAEQGEVKQQAVALVNGWLRFAVVNGKLTQPEADEYSAVASVVIASLMAANVSSCIPAGS
jgi:hypothetical protein